ncbi:MAG TPA: serine hydrolase domain-containing protein [Pyrinomonadaceae bacterium]|jgi:CubicO group peptidase (beta-lactamase class C family)|nr:serine hydrolase domain-containing protein [Pyrinomonadaceae bacterium]
MTERTEGEREPRITTMLEERIAAGDFPSAVYLVAERGSVRFADALGDAVREPTRHAATPETIYDLASLTKPLVTGLLTALCVERRRVELDGAVARYLPEFEREDKRAITVRQLLTHTSGLPAWRPLYLLAAGDPAHALEVIASQTLEQAPGARVVYSDLGFITLGLLLQRVSAAPLDELARREIFAPLGLKRTFFNPEKSLQTEVAACESAGNAYEREMCETQHGPQPDGNWRTRPIWGEVHDGNAFFLGGASGHAGLFSTARDSLRLAEQFLPRSTRLLAPATCALFRTNMTEGLNEARSFAWQLAATPDSTAGPLLPPESFGHLGFTGTSCWLDPTRERVYILLTNRTHARSLPFVNINSVRRRFHTLAAEALERAAQNREP